MTKYIERETARKLRKNGLSLAEIAQELKVSKSSACKWTEDIVLTAEQTQRLKQKQRVNVALQAQGLKNKIAARAVRDRHREESKRWLTENPDPALFAFAALYWGEGIKNRNKVAIGTSDSKMLYFFTEILRKIFNVSEDRLHLDILLHFGINAADAVDFWKSSLRWTSGRVHPVRFAVPKSSKQVTAHRCPFGTARVSVYDTKLRATIEGMMDVVKDSILL